MRGFFYGLFSLFLSPLGLFALAALDSSLLFFLPIAVDAGVILLSARDPEIFWVFPVLATAGSMMGATVTFWIGCKIGANSLERWIPERRLQAVHTKIKDKGAIALAIPALMPPPFPLTPFVLACGALSVNRNKFMATFAAMRMLRFTVESILAVKYGRRILQWMESDAFQWLIVGLVGVALIGSAFTIYRLVVTTRSGRCRQSPRKRPAA